MIVGSFCTPDEDVILVGGTCVCLTYIGVLDLGAIGLRIELRTGDVLDDDDEAKHKTTTINYNFTVLREEK